MKKFVSLFVFLLTFFLIISLGIQTYFDKKTIISYKKKEEKLKKDLDKTKKEIKKKIVNKVDSNNIDKINEVFLITKNNLTNEEKQILIKKISEWIISTYPKAYKRLANEISSYLINNSKIPLLMLGIIGAESSFRIQLRNHLDAVGLCQIRYFIWKKEAPDKLKEFGINSLSELYDPIKNLKLSEYILLKYMSELHNIKDALVKYQTGKNKLDNLTPKQKIKTRDYINKIFLTCGKVYVYISLN